MKRILLECGAWFGPLRRKRIVALWLISGLVVATVAAIGLLLWQTFQTPKAGTVRLALVSYLPPRTAQVAIYNDNSEPIVVWGPSRVERKAGGRIVAGGSAKTVSVVSGKSGRP